MKEYHKIVNVWSRDPENRFKTLIEDSWGEPEFGFLSGNKWVWTEKIDGTNIRVMWDGENVTLGGRTDNAQIHAQLIERLNELFYAGTLSNIFDGSACLYGEGFGAKIQKGGGNYAGHMDFCLFDVRAGDMWLKREDVEEIANRLGIQVAPIVGRGTLNEAIDHVRQGFSSHWGDFEAEGLVARPAIEMLNRRGKRIITKIKCKDFKGGSHGKNSRDSATRTHTTDGGTGE